MDVFDTNETIYLFITLLETKKAPVPQFQENIKIIIPADIHDIYNWTRQFLKSELLVLVQLCEVCGVLVVSICIVLSCYTTHQPAGHAC